MLKDKVLAMVFQKPSLRTRVSFDMAMRHLGGDALYLSPLEIGLGKRESIADVARVLSGYVDILMARVFAHDHIMQLAKFSTIPVINGLSDFNHPCQGLADGLTILEHFGQIKGLNITFIGDGNNVCNSLIIGCKKVGMKVSVAVPKGYEPKEKPDLLTNDPKEACKNAQVVYTDTWISMGQEDEKEEKVKTFKSFQVNSELASHADPNFIFMHPLPAYRGYEMTSEIIDGEHSVVWQQAENRMHVQKAILKLLM